MRLPTLAAVAMLLATPAVAASVEADAKLQKRLGVTVQAVAAARHAGATTGFARVLDPGPLAQLDADLLAAAAAAQASNAEAARTRALAAADATVARKVAEAAAAQARADSAKLTLLRRRLGLEWGPVFMAMSDARRAALISNLATGRAALVRLDAGVPLAGVRWATLDLGGGSRAMVQVIGAARTGDPRFPSSGLIGLVSGPGAQSLGAGLSLPVSLASGSGGQGVVVPRSALIRTGGGTFVYVRKDATHFERRALTGTAAEPEGLFVGGGLKAGEVVAVTGAAALYAAEQAPKGEEP
ncbi:MAG: hypothetical protein Q7V13_09930 [Phenylobacterium sp.]|uniref:hypothetical protein n=1 Tax=Phenylobacterium sp. TaxID=1871053 RepID=UPI00272405CD|nr:hypothetical protein [Phenylobacterium sp.]MDO8912159.1 hypothetical protein [Phenylobacterium sp.]